MKRWTRYAVPLLVTVALVAAVIYAFLPSAVPVDVAVVSRGPLRVTVDEDGKTRIRERYIISAPLQGQLHRIELHAGDPVSAGGTVLASIEPIDPSLLDIRSLTSTKARVRAAEAAVELAQAKSEGAREKHELSKHEYERVMKLRANRVVSQQDADAAEHAERVAHHESRATQFALEVARFELELARAALIRAEPNTSESPKTRRRLDIRAPISGRVLRVFQESAGVITPGMKLLEVGDPYDLEIEVDVLSRDAVNIRPGQKAFLEQWGGDSPLNARVRLVEPAGFLKISALGVEEQRVNVILDLIDPPEKRVSLGDGFRVEARIITWEDANVLKIPAGALFRQGDAWAVFTIANARARLRQVAVGKSNGLETSIVGGLSEGEQIILHPSDRVHDGVRVTTRNR